MTLKVLFVCSKNQWRSPTAEQIFADYPTIECTSAGLSHDAQNPLTAELVAWANLIFVMEPKHTVKLRAKYRAQLTSARVICLNIADNYTFMDPALVLLLETKVLRFLPAYRVLK
ncbi:MAG: phosphotyrosine protein phosphatase [Pseudomonas sp.]|uniref:low molecular weight protein tyrosine phosphatase family protein n=1 Tax=Pseudomonas sp. TaxID=306 RepID=UPI002734836E|nr:phosphotyrosine protein phosphatase [Pseudomonas sp.]MDP3847843.1 phosphotyrosine protein phosphatase [Pseudomonas sp.]